VSGSSPITAASALGWRQLEILSDVFSDVFDPRKMRARWSADLRDVSARFLRSPLFLEWTRWNLGAMTTSVRIMSVFRP
jgi:hypothetical protein